MARPTNLPRLRYVATAFVLGAFSWCVWNAWVIWNSPWAPGLSFRQASGLGFVPLAIPILITGAATLLAGVGRGVWVSALGGVFVLYAFVTGFSIGSAYIPVSAPLFVGAILSLLDQSRTEDADRRTQT